MSLILSSTELYSPKTEQYSLRDPLSIVRIIEELLEWKNSDSVLENKRLPATLPIEVGTNFADQRRSIVEDEVGGACSVNGEKMNVYRLLAGKPGGKRPLGRTDVGGRITLR
jgi:hypothetical protein